MVTKAATTAPKRMMFAAEVIIIYHTLPSRPGEFQ